MKKWIIEKETMRELENQKVLFEFGGKTEELKKQLLQCIREECKRLSRFSPVTSIGANTMSDIQENSNGSLYVEAVYKDEEGDLYKEYYTAFPMEKIQKLNKNITLSSL